MTVELDEQNRLELNLLEIKNKIKSKIKFDKYPFIKFDGISYIHEFEGGIRVKYKSQYNTVGYTSEVFLPFEYFNNTESWIVENEKYDNLDCLNKVKNEITKYSSILERIKL